MKMLKLLVAGTILAASSMAMANTMGYYEGTYDDGKGFVAKFTLTEVSENVWLDASDQRDGNIERDDAYIQMLLGAGTISEMVGSVGSHHMGEVLPVRKVETTLYGKLITDANGDRRILWINSDGTTMVGPVLVFHDSDYNWNGTDSSDVEVNPKVQDINPKVQG